MLVLQNTKKFTCSAHRFFAPINAMLVTGQRLLSLPIPIKTGLSHILVATGSCFFNHCELRSAAFQRGNANNLFSHHSSQRFNHGVMLEPVHA